MSPKREIDRFLVKTKSGKAYTIVQLQDYEDIPTGGSVPPSELTGLMSFLTTTDLRVAYIDAETFKIISTDEIVRKV